MTKQERLVDMLKYVQEMKHFHLIDIMEKYNISNRTSKRDVQALKRSGLKIQSVPGIQGGCTVIDDESIRCLFLKEKEIEVICRALRRVGGNDLGLMDKSTGLLMEKLSSK